MWTLEEKKFLTNFQDNHPRIVQAVKNQMNNLVHSTTMYFNESNVLLAEELVKTFPKGHDWFQIFFNIFKGCPLCFEWK
jgi:4-aminobutyrate aminotransferase-like enzyme